MGISADAAGNLYVVESGNARVQKFSGAGASLPAPAPPAFLLTWGTPGSGNGQFASLRGVAIDGAGNVYVTDASNNRIQKFTAGGVYITQWGSVRDAGATREYPRDSSSKRPAFSVTSSRSPHTPEKDGGHLRGWPHWTTHALTWGRSISPNHDQS